MQNCETSFGDGKIVDFSQIKVQRVNKTKARGVFGPIIVHEPINNNYEMEELIYTKQGGEYRQMPFRIQKVKLHEFFKNDKTFYPDMIAMSDIPFPTPCPLPKVIVQ